MFATIPAPSSRPGFWGRLGRTLLGAAKPVFEE